LKTVVFSRDERLVRGPRSNLSVGGTIVAIKPFLREFQTADELAKRRTK